MRMGIRCICTRTAIPILRIYIIPVANHLGADLLEFALPETAEVVSGKKISRQLLRMWEDRLR